MQRAVTATRTGRGGLALVIGIGAMVVAFAASDDAAHSRAALRST